MGWADIRPANLASLGFEESASEKPSHNADGITILSHRDPHWAPLPRDISKRFPAQAYPCPIPEDEGDTGSSVSSDGDAESHFGDSDTVSVISYQTSNTSCSGDSLSDDVHEHEQQHRGSHHEDSGYFSLAKDFEDPEQHAALPRLEEHRLEYPSCLDVAHGREGDAIPQPPSSTQQQPRAQLPAQPTIPSNRCRRRSSDSTAVQPPSLKRDTDTADLFVHQLIAFTCRLVTAIWPLAATPPMMTACFNGAGVLPLHTFIYETLRRSKTSYSTLQIALYYLVMLKPKLPGLDFTKEQPKSQNTTSGKEAQGCRAMQCGRRMFLSALMLASKYIQDRNYSTRAWSKISGLRIPEINDNEREYLRLIDYDLHLKQETFENWSKVVLLLSRMSKFQPGCFDHMSGAGPEPEPGAKNIYATACTGSQRPVIYSHQWWSEICKDLDPETFKDSLETDAFVKQRIPLGQVGSGSNIPPVPPRAMQGNSDMTFSDAFGSGGPLSNVSTPVQMAASSPAQPMDLPIRPQPRKLQTPQSTPRGSDALPGLGVSHNGRKCPRTSASVDALRNLCTRRQAYYASIDRCPPPQPQQSAKLAGTQHLTSSLLGADRGYRSRSNSNSSNSSNSSGATNQHDSSRSSCSPSTSLPRKSNGLVQHCSISRSEEMLRPLRRKSGFSFSETRYIQGTDRGAPMEPRAVDDEADAIAASALVDLRVGDRQSLTPTPAPGSQSASRDSTPKASQQRSFLRGHKRTISKANDDLHNTVRESLMDLQCESDLVEDSSDDSSATESDVVDIKQLQKPCRTWAQMKRPISNAQLNKRLALGCGSQQRQLSASERAAIFLRPDLYRQLVG